MNLAHLTQYLTQTSIPGLPELPATAFNINLYDTLVSTNQTLWELVDQGANEGTVAIALQQRGGRGQWGRQWQSSPGGLYLSIALTPHLAATQAAQLTLCSAWGIATALNHYEVPVELKWPNDLVVQGRKLGGILTETRISQGIIRQAIVGVGLNWVNAVPAMGINLQTVMATHSQPTIASLEKLAAIALQGIMGGYQQWQHQGIEAILPHYHALLTGVGQPVRLDDGLGEIVGVSSSGELRVRLQPSEKAAAIAEISVKPGAVRLGYEWSDREPNRFEERLD
ncbi:MAG: biotin--[acetyl-CoA-carboxylase] ligase [Oculatellaceae cyanobacterium bins.114]|nr:biotin--[acetyl-CoA-carboxylase] ligase [Oculatellaceae cyanobacterium bins.114]